MHNIRIRSPLLAYLHVRLLQKRAGGKGGRRKEKRPGLQKAETGGNTEKAGWARELKIFTRCVHTMVSRNQGILHQTLLITLSKKTTAKMEFANLQSF